MNKIVDRGDSERSLAFTQVGTRRPSIFRFCDQLVGTNATPKLRTFSPTSSIQFEFGAVCAIVVIVLLRKYRWMRSVKLLEPWDDDLWLHIANTMNEVTK